MINFPPGFTIWRGQPGSCANAREDAVKIRLRIPIESFVYRIATFHRKYKASKRVFMGFRLIVRC